MRQGRSAGPVKTGPVGESFIVNSSRLASGRGQAALGLGIGVAMRVWAATIVMQITAMISIEKRS